MGIYLKIAENTGKWFLKAFSLTKRVAYVWPRYDTLISGSW